MDTPQPPILNPEQRLALENQQRTERYMRNVAIGGVILCPAIALMPPRKLDLYTFALGMGFYLSADHLSTHYTGHGLVEQITPRWTSLPTEKARETQRLLANEKALEDAKKGIKDIPKENRGFLYRLWMGDEDEGWQERRLAAERKALEEGRGYQGIILDQIWEVWNRGDKKAKDEGTTPESTKGEPKKP